MSYQVLARKWRPKSFEELVGQKQTAKALINALETQRLHHAYLFTGTRGVGKTTIARILSKSLNCETGITSKPCGTCSSCLEIDQGSFVDLMEIDAASKTKVEDTRELLDNVQYRPTRGRYKVYLIDEVHMLSGHSFNALLKTLEEPPPHVIFLLATTDPQKLPVTVLSRCLQFHLKRMEPQQIIDHLSMILKAEQIEFEQGSLQPIAKGADGSMRDGLSLLDQAIAFSGAKIELKAVLEMLGSIDQSFCSKIFSAVHDNDATLLMNIIKDMAQYSPNYAEVMSDWLSMLHGIAVCQSTGFSDSDVIIELSGQISAADVQLYYQLSLQAKKDLPFAPNPRQGFEMAMLRILAFKPQLKPGQVSAPSEASKKKVIKNAPTDNSDKLDEPSANKNTLADAENESKEEIKVETSPKFSEPNRETEIDSDSNLINQVAGIALEPQRSSRSDSSNVVRLNQVKRSNQNSKTDLVKETDLIKRTEQDQVKSRTIAEPKLNVNSIAQATEEAQINSETVETLKKRWYPEAEKIELKEINFENWHLALDQMNIAANGLQILLNSLASYQDNKLQIQHLEKVSHFLTEKLRQSLTNEILVYFDSNKLKVEFNEVQELSRTPKERQQEIIEENTESAYQQFVSNPCIMVLQKQTGALINKSNITLKM